MVYSPQLPLTQEPGTTILSEEGQNTTNPRDSHSTVVSECLGAIYFQSLSVDERDERAAAASSGNLSRI